MITSRNDPVGAQGRLREGLTPFFFLTVEGHYTSRRRGKFPGTPDVERLLW